MREAPFDLFPSLSFPLRLSQEKQIFIEQLGRRSPHPEAAFWQYKFSLQVPHDHREGSPVISHGSFHTLSRSLYLFRPLERF